MTPPTSRHIQAVVANHNTSRYTELMLRSLFATHSPSLDLAITVLDNGSQDDMTDLMAYAQSKGIPVLTSGFEIKSEWNSHGEVLSQFVLKHPDCAYYLFLDADVVFLQDDTIDTMVQELERDQAAFGIGARMSWDGENEIPETKRAENPDLYDTRLHPCCALVKNTELFRRVVEEIGLSCAKMLWARGEEYLDTFKLMTKVMRTHGYHHLRSSSMVLHFFCVSYDWSPEEIVEAQRRQRDKLLETLRGHPPLPPDSSPAPV